MSKTISTLTELVSVMTTLKGNCGGQYVTLYGRKAKSLNKGRGVNAIDPNFVPINDFRVKYHFAEDYDKKMDKLLKSGLDVPTYSQEQRNNREHLVHNVLMRYKSTGTICFIAMPTSWYDDGLTLNGKPLTDSEIAYMKKYLKKASKSTIDYVTIGIKNIYKIVADKETYFIDIQD